MASKFLAERIYTMINEQGDTVVCLPCKGISKIQVDMALNELRATDAKIAVSLQVAKSSRSLEQNRMLWTLLEKITDATTGRHTEDDVWNIYCDMLMRANVKSDFYICIPEAEEMLRRQFRAIRFRGNREVNGKVLNVYQVFEGSSHFTTTEMKQLIDLCLDEIGELGIMDSEISYIKENR